MDRLTFDPTKILLSLNYYEFVASLDHKGELKPITKVKIIYLIEIFCFSQNERDKIGINNEIVEYKDMGNEIPQPINELTPVFEQCINFMRIILRLFYYSYSNPNVKHDITRHSKFKEPLITNMQSLYNKIKTLPTFKYITDPDALSTMIIIIYRFLKSMEYIFVPINQIHNINMFLTYNFSTQKIDKIEKKYIQDILTYKRIMFYDDHKDEDETVLKLEEIGKKYGEEPIINNTFRIQIERSKGIKHVFKYNVDYNRIMKFFGPDITIEDMGKNVKDFDVDRNKGVLLDKTEEEKIVNRIDSVYSVADTDVSYTDVSYTDVSYFPTFFILKESTISFPVIFEKSKSPRRSKSTRRSRSRSPKRSKSPKRSRTKKTKYSPRKIKKKK